MPFDRGNISFSMFEIPEELPENIIDLFAAHKAGTLDSVNEEPQVGWVTGHHLLDTNIDMESAQMGGCYFLTLRQAVRKMPSVLLDAICKREEAAYLKANNLERISGKIRRQIKEEAIERHIQKMPPALSGISLVLEPHSRLLFVSATSQSQIDMFVENFFQTVKIEPIQLTPGKILFSEFQVSTNAFPELEIGEQRSAAEPSIGRDFLTYLWYYGETIGKVNHPEYGEFDILIEPPLVFMGDGDDRGAGEMVLKKGGSPLRSAEAKAAVAVGKKLRKVKLSLTRLNQVWTGTFDADMFSFSGFKLPEGEEMNQFEIFAERIENLKIFREGFIAYFKMFAQAMLGEERAATCEAIRNWAKNRDAI